VSWTTIAAIYFIVWWLVLFAVLPWGISSQYEAGEIAPGTDPGAPASHGLKAKLVWTTAVSAVLFGLFYWAFVTRTVTFEDLATLWGLLAP
jgi:predicted secreted protein